MLAEKDTIGGMANAHWAGKGKHGLKRASWKLEWHSNC